jgi:WD40 repeat protein
VDTKTGQVTQRLQQTSPYSGLSFVDNTSWLQAITNQQRFTFDAAEPESGYYFYDNYTQRSHIGLMPKGNTMLTADKTADGAITLCMTTFNDDTNCQSVTLIPNGTRQLAITQNFSLMVLSTTDISTFLVDVLREEIIDASILSTPILSVAAHPTQPIFALGILTGTLLIDENGNILQRLASHSDKGVVSTAFDPSGRYLLTLSGTLAEVWDVQRALSPLPVHAQEATE